VICGVGCGVCDLLGCVVGWGGLSVRESKGGKWWRFNGDVVVICGVLCGVLCSVWAVCGSSVRESTDR
jgi:hypothetical protein